MQRANYKRFDFDFDKFYREMTRKQKKGFLHVGSYYNLSIRDFCHDVLIRTITYFDKNEPEKPISKDSFENIFWTTAKFQKLKSIHPRKRTEEYKNFVQMSSIEPTKEEPTHKDYIQMENSSARHQPDLDDLDLIKLIQENYPSINKVMEGYSRKEAGEMESIGERGFTGRYLKEMNKIKQNYAEYFN